MGADCAPGYLRLKGWYFPKSSTKPLRGNHAEKTAILKRPSPKTEADAENTAFTLFYHDVDLFSAPKIGGGRRLIPLPSTRRPPTPFVTGNLFDLAPAIGLLGVSFIFA